MEWEGIEIRSEDPPVSGGDPEMWGCVAGRGCSWWSLLPASSSGFFTPSLELQLVWQKAPVDGWGSLSKTPEECCAALRRQPWEGRLSMGARKQPGEQLEWARPG